jgi:uncharacterized protein (DUF1330 family)
MTNPTSAVNPSQQSIDALSLRADNDPVIMVNLLRFRGDEGRASYARYGAVSGREISSRGGRVIYHGVAIGDSFWDSVALVYYPRRSAWIDMQASDAYQAAIPDRTAGLKNRLLFSFSQRPGTPALDDIKRCSDDEIFVVNLLHFAADNGREEYGKYGSVASNLITKSGGEVALHLDADQAMVSDDPWDNFILVRYPSIGALQAMVSSETWQRADREHRQVGLRNTIAFPTRQR